MSSVAGSVKHVPRFQHLATYWKERGRTIETMKDLILCYYFSISVVRIPVKGRYMLLNDQVSKLQDEIASCCNLSYNIKRKARMLLTIDELDIYL